MRQAMLLHELSHVLHQIENFKSSFQETQRGDGVHVTADAAILSAYKRAMESCRCENPKSQKPSPWTLNQTLNPKP
jgi:hypothetical protein